MEDHLLSAKEAAKRLGISPPTLYDWLGQSDHGMLVIRGERMTIRYFQSGPRGQGRIQIEASELDRIMECMRVYPARPSTRKPQSQSSGLPGITAKLGKPPN